MAAIIHKDNCVGWQTYWYMKPQPAFPEEIAYAGQEVAVIAAEPVEFPGGRWVSRSMDNRLGCFVALEAARLVAEAGGAPGDVFALAVAQEEITFAGARTTAYSLPISTQAGM